MVYPLLKAVWRFVKSYSIGLAYESPIPFLGIYISKGIESMYLCKNLYTDVHSTIIPNDQKVETVQMFIN